MSPIWLITDGLIGRKAPVAWSEADQVLPMLSTSGPWPDVVAARIRLSRSFQPMTSQIDLDAGLLGEGLLSSGVSTLTSSAMELPWSLAQ